MANYIAVYDLRSARLDPHGAFIEEAAKVGWGPWIWGPTSNKWLRLPNTTLIGQYDSAASAKKAFDDAATATSTRLGIEVIVEKFLIATYSPVSWRSDEKADP